MWFEFIVSLRCRAWRAAHQLLHVGMGCEAKLPSLPFIIFMPARGVCQSNPHEELISDGFSREWSRLAH
jgi:hypothetical protein